jgi:FkbM family methyltransferase
MGLLNKLRYHYGKQMEGARNRHLNIKVNQKHEWLGNGYGGFFVCPDFIDTSSIVYSFGIGEDISFDMELITRFNCTVFGFDPTPKSVNWIQNQELPENFKFFEYGIGRKTKMQTFYLPKNPDHVSGSLIAHNNVAQDQAVQVQMKSFEDIIIQLGHSHIDILKMDIEGAEYDVLENILNAGIDINQILIEFHDRFFEDGHHRTKMAIQFLRSKGYSIFAVSKSKEEISFIKKI